MHSPDRQKIENFIFELAPTFTTIFDYPNIKKMKGSDDFYRLRFGDYRVGIHFKDDVLNFVRVAHRKDIYKKFP